MKATLCADEKHPKLFSQLDVDDFVGNHSMYEITVELQKFFWVSVCHGDHVFLLLLGFCKQKTFELTYVILVVLVGG